jgi:hypothetical protein
MKRWMAFVLGAAVGWCGASLRRLRSENMYPAPLGWIEVDSFYLREDGWAVVRADFGWHCCSPADVRVIVDGELCPEVLEAFGNHRYGMRVGWWRSVDDIGVGDVRVFVRGARSVFRRGDDHVPGHWVLGGAGA